MRRLDYREQLVDYFKRNIRKGYTPESLKFSLMKQGYSRVAIDQALFQANKEMAEKAPAFKEKPVITYEVLDQNNKPIKLRNSFWRKFKGLFK